MILPVITGNEKKIGQFYTYGVAKVINSGLINGTTESMGCSENTIRNFERKIYDKILKIPKVF